MLDAGVITLDSGRQLFVQVSDGATSESPTIFLLHGLGSSHTFYSTSLSLAPSLASHFRLISYDFNGHGLSPFSPPLSIESLAQDLKDLMDHFQVDKAAGVVGHSMSGLVATTFAAKWPDKVDKLLLLGPVSSLASTSRTGMLSRASTVTSSGLSTIVHTIAQSATSSRTKSFSPLALSLIRSLVLGTNPEAYAAACTALAEAQDPEYGRIKAEALGVGGAEDYLSSPEMIARIVGAIGQTAHSVELEGVGHWHALEDPKRVAEEMEKWFVVE